MRRDDWLLQQLPVAMVEDDFLSRFVMIFQTIADTELHHVDTMHHLVDPTVAPDPMVRLMGAWIGVDWIDSSLPDELQRDLVRGYSNLIRWRGTRRGLQLLLELVTSGEATVWDNGGVFAEGDAPVIDPHVVLKVASTGWATERDLLRIVRAELPANVTFELYVGDRQLWPQALQVAGTSTAALPGRPNDDTLEAMAASPVFAAPFPPPGPSSDATAGPVAGTGDTSDGGSSL